MSDAVIVDRGYRHYDGVRLGRRGAIRAVIREGIRRALGLRRKARSKILPWLLVGFAGIALAVAVGMQWAALRFGVAGILESELPTYSDFFDMISTIALLFIALVTPELLIPDRRQGVLAVYFSRPLQPVDYLAAKFAALGILIMAFYLVPETIFHLSLATLAEEGFFSYLGDNLRVLWQVPAAAAVYFLGQASIAFVISAYVPRRGVAAGVFLGVMTIMTPLVDHIVTLSSVSWARYIAFLGFLEHPGVVRDWIFGVTTGNPVMRRVGFDPWVSLAAVAVLTGAAGVLVWNRYRRLA